MYLLCFFPTVLLLGGGSFVSGVRTRVACVLACWYCDMLHAPLSSVFALTFVVVLFVAVVGACDI